MQQTIEREIRYSRETKDYDLYLDGEYVGSAGSYLDGEQKLNELVYEMLVHTGPAVEIAKALKLIEA